MTSDICVTLCAVKKFVFCVCEIRCLKKRYKKKTDPDLSTVSSNSESEVPAKKRTWAG